MGPDNDANDLIQSLRNVREDITPMIKGMESWTATRPTSGAEVTLGLRKLQEARMWFGVAEAIEKGLDPWANQVEEKE